MRSTISFDCNECHHAVSGDVDVPDTNMEDNEGAFSEDILDCPNCGRPHSVTINNRGGLVLAVVDGVPLQDGAVSTPDPASELNDAFQAQWAEDFEWYSSVSQQTVFEYFSASMASLRDMQTIDIADRYQAEVFNRMLLVQGIASMESYLSDTLISRVIADPARLRKLFEFDRELRSNRYPMMPFLEDEDFPKKVANDYLANLIYHNLPRIELLYRSVLDVGFVYGSEKTKVRLLKAIQVRHDCVHRNGKTKDHGDFQIIDRAYVTQVTRDIEAFVSSIEKDLALDDEIPF